MKYHRQILVVYHRGSASAIALKVMLRIFVTKSIDLYGSILKCSKQINVYTCILFAQVLPEFHGLRKSRALLLDWYSCPLVELTAI